MNLPIDCDPKLYASHGGSREAGAVSSLRTLASCQTSWQGSDMKLLMGYKKAASLYHPSDTLKYLRNKNHE